LRHCATSRKVAGSIPDGVTDIILPAALYGIFVNCNWVDTRWQKDSTLLRTNNTQNNTMKHNTQNGTYITIRILKTNKRIHNLTIKIHNL